MPASKLGLVNHLPTAFACDVKQQLSGKPVLLLGVAALGYVYCSLQSLLRPCYLNKCFLTGASCCHLLHFREARVPEVIPSLLDLVWGPSGAKPVGFLIDILLLLCLL